MEIFRPSKDLARLLHRKNPEEGTDVLLTCRHTHTRKEARTQNTQLQISV